MIKSHPTEQMLRAFAANELPLPLAVGVSAHCELCPECAARVTLWEAQLAEALEAAPLPDQVAPELDAMLAMIVQQPLPELIPVSHTDTQLEVAGRCYRLPRVLARYRSPKWRHFGPVRQHSLPLGELGVRASLLHIDAGGAIPEHTHQGYELTLLLAGSMQDGDQRYGAGDFIWRDSRHAHSPHTVDGCLCYTVQDAPIQFTKGLSRLLNGISGHLY
ncbi:putative transcriptional regulator [Aeromonas sp. BIGb0405]|jgi:putative transcriptional regulator|uniref:ChrR family anti-sigma-E factor n=1 Tax=Aeromonas TaxID=642 RepID=UPI001CCF8A7B|nr:MULTISPECIES: ChrR family anti-sigma-E factor [Aeromonas]MCS3457074.1 putative transcriptional regulator [Aeromonas sp. BIGb0405]MCS3460731.1 putative transcriptional regulator [Aeromonas sp. BIGb0445]UBO73845.1 ChrR family anti-sigma-E factor [Aeromonas rivuli]